MKYGTLLMDPPWIYRQVLGRGARAGHTTRGGLPYSPMTLAEIEDVHPERYADKNCALWLWATNVHLHSAFHMLEAWGFEYKTMVAWVKTGFGLGYWLRGATEHLLLGVKGNPRAMMSGPHGTTGKSWSTAVIEKRSKHSTKPEIFIDRPR